MSLSYRLSQERHFDLGNDFPIRQPRVQFRWGGRVDSNYYGFLIELSVCSNDVWIADHDFGYQIGEAGYSDFFDFLAKVALNVWDDEGGSSRKMRGKRNEQRLFGSSTACSVVRGG